MKRIYDEENVPYEDEEDDMTGYTLNEENSIFKKFIPEPEPETIASPIPQNEQTVILADPHTAGLKDGQELSIVFDETCRILDGTRTVGTLKAAYAAKLCAARGGQKTRVYYKAATPPMVRLVFGDGTLIPMPPQTEA